MMNLDILLTIANIIFLFIAPFIVLGIIKKTKAFWGARKGVSIFQPIYDTVKLFKKDRTISKTTSWVFSFTLPFLTLGGKKSLIVSASLK